MKKNSIIILAYFKNLLSEFPFIIFFSREIYTLCNKGKKKIFFIENFIYSNKDKKIFFISTNTKFGN